ncbi:hypothetical protein WS70_28475 [Burkholderia mayonis]|uniref:Uncharacterized protein n=1 Tax=Burkholderia mayonis TaxID=1385591 RepID=A0A1B4FPJ3_9BURK|nr:hypothetical protein WS70_28475 [Burkholderia mayonis]KVE34696.1 hypothetical protein WS69_16090 [Burkholderia sp. BDU5]KVE43977.1 hypothetical protein WS70_08455 [Burkholderia mayonis]
MTASGDVLRAFASARGREARSRAGASCERASPPGAQVVVARPVPLVVRTGGARPHQSKQNEASAPKPFARQAGKPSNGKPSESKTKQTSGF